MNVSIQTLYDNVQAGNKDNIVTRLLEDEDSKEIGKMLMLLGILIMEVGVVLGKKKGSESDLC